jgi:2-polyprenyl-6-methoxyphenol hydroxylase-like FAD-dependent oxidoreductase
VINRYDTPVLIVGGGPVGLLLAFDLGRRGVDCLLVERRPTEGILPKMELTNARSMEILGRLGLADKVRQAGWPSETPMDVWIGPSLVEAPYHVLAYPSVEQERERIARCRDLSWPREAYHRISQYTLERLLRDEVAAHPRITARFGHSLDSFVQNADGVEAVVHDEYQNAHAVRCRFMVGCDGGNSTVRRALDVPLLGKQSVRRSLLIFFRCADLLTKAGLPPARHYYLAGQRQGTLVTQDDFQRWALHLQIADDVDADAIDPRAEMQAALGIDLDAEILHVGPWHAHLVVAEQYRVGNVFLAGDAAHQYIPTGGFGMNTGVGDADNLAWKLAAVLRGWGGEALLASYQSERRQIGLRNCRASEYAAAGGRAWREAVHLSVMTDTCEGRVRRAELVRAIDTGQRRSHEMHGIELGYRYTQSEICAQEAGGPDPDRPGYEPTALPGARLPHAWIAPGLSVHDLVRDGMTLLVHERTSPLGHVFEDAARKMDLPLTVVPRLDDRLCGLYGAGALLLRPDLHVAWRGNETNNAAAILNAARGHGRFDAAASAPLRAPAPATQSAI